MADYETIEFIQATITNLLDRMGINARIEYEDSLLSGLIFNIRSRDAKLLIGNKGNTLYSLEHIIHSIVSRQLSQKHPDQDNRILFSIDVDDYKRNRQYQIKQLVKDEISNMKRSGQPANLPAMPKYERKFVHMYIQELYPHVSTESIGAEPNRYIRLSI